MILEKMAMLLWRAENLSLILRQRAENLSLILRQRGLMKKRKPVVPKIIQKEPQWILLQRQKSYLL